MELDHILYRFLPSGFSPFELIAFGTLFFCNENDENESAGRLWSRPARSRSYLKRVRRDNNQIRADDGIVCCDLILMSAWFFFHDTNSWQHANSWRQILRCVAWVFRTYIWKKNRGFKNIGMTDYPSHLDRRKQIAWSNIHQVINQVFVYEQMLRSVRLFIFSVWFVYLLDGHLAYCYTN